MVRIALTLMLLLALAAAAVAYDQLYTGDSAQVAEEPSFGIEGTFLYMTANSEFDADGQTVVKAQRETVGDSQEFDAINGEVLTVRITE